jgi:hypothetical protein
MYFICLDRVVTSQKNVARHQAIAVTIAIGAAFSDKHSLSKTLDEVFP